MGMLDRWFGGHHAYPPLEPESDARHYLDDMQDELENLAGNVRGPLEVVPSDHDAFVFIGKPPEQFGLAWIHDGKVSSFQSMTEELHLSRSEANHLVEALRAAYEHAAEARRYSATIGRRKVTVTPSPLLEREMHDIIEHIH